jgi:hypothetical protein
MIGGIRMTKNRVIQKESISEFEQALNQINTEYENKVFATQTHVTVIGGTAKYTAVFFIKD